MKHRVAFRKFSRTSSHRNLMLRNLVTSLFEHEQIQTTLPKAKDTARLAEKVITMGKKNNLSAFRRATAFLLKPEVVPKVFETFAARYADRPGGYTRIHKFGNRTGDNAPTAILELVDNPRDIKTEMTARAVGWEMLRENRKHRDIGSIRDEGLRGTKDLIDVERRLRPEKAGRLRPLTRWNLQKTLKYKDSAAVEAFRQKAEDYVDHLLAKSRSGMLAKPAGIAVDNKPVVGWAVPGETPGAMRAVQGALAKPQWKPQWKPKWALHSAQSSQNGFLATRTAPQ
ncbi:hypothetical protein PLICRDRAFT_396990 [Plicaturopsis crispa FD-325 SS-3]|nr:hypothetical protein PLICRDRAFT_396990 [Plicaturopsis crispa FD-325 SS-3]